MSKRTIQGFKVKKRTTNEFDPALVKEYGEQTYRDYKRRTQFGAKSRYEDAAWSSAYVAWGCSYITEKEIPKFLKAIVRYAKTHKFPSNFV